MNIDDQCDGQWFIGSNASEGERVRKREGGWGGGGQERQAETIKDQSSWSAGLYEKKKIMKQGEVERGGWRPVPYRRSTPNKTSKAPGHSAKHPHPYAAPAAASEHWCQRFMEMTHMLSNFVCAHAHVCVRAFLRPHIPIKWQFFWFLKYFYMQYHYVSCVCVCPMCF